VNFSHIPKFEILGLDRTTPLNRNLITSKALPNVRGARVQLGSRARSTFIDLRAISIVDAVDFRRPDRLASEHPFSSHLV
jgi:hypothetical protein